MTKIEWKLEIATVSEANTSEHWAISSKRHKMQQLFVRMSFEKYVKEMELPCNITLTRLAPRFLDDDNNVIAFKWIRDELSECIIPDRRKHCLTKKGRIKAIKGLADSDKRITWSYDQEKSPVYAIKICIEY